MAELALRKWADRLVVTRFVQMLCDLGASLVVLALVNWVEPASAGYLVTFLGELGAPLLVVTVDMRVERSVLPCLDALAPLVMLMHLA